MRDIDVGEWKPVPNGPTLTFLAIFFAVEVAIVVGAVCFFYVKGWL